MGPVVGERLMKKVKDADVAFGLGRYRGVSCECYQVKDLMNGCVLIIREYLWKTSARGRTSKVGHSGQQSLD
jgi:hypothetical protein